MESGNIIVLKKLFPVVSRCPFLSILLPLSSDGQWSKVNVTSSLKGEASISSGRSGWEKTSNTYSSSWTIAAGTVWFFLHLPSSQVPTSQMRSSKIKKSKTTLKPVKEWGRVERSQVRQLGNQKTWSGPFFIDSSLFCDLGQPTSLLSELL